jgi:hypothetical protein
MSSICEYSGLPNTQSYITNPQAEGAGVGGESLEENFIDSKSEEQSKSEELDNSNSVKSIDFMYNWIRKHSGK